jgi:hypothetical protein
VVDILGSIISAPHDNDNLFHFPAAYQRLEESVRHYSIHKADEYNNTAPHFVTFTVLHWIPIFTNPATVNIIFNSLKFLQKEGLKINAFVILEKFIPFSCSVSKIGRIC